MNSIDHSIAAVLPLLARARSAVLTTHVNPDGDGLGSELALAEWLISRGCTATVINHSETPEVYRFLHGAPEIRLYDPARDAGLIAGAELILVLDTNQPDRLRSMQEAVLSTAAVKICVDHHLDPHPFAAHYLIDPDATSTGEIIYRLLVQAAGRTLPATIASSLYCAIMTDTGSFRYPRVDPEVFRIAAHLVECGADPVRIFSEVYDQWSGGRIHLLGQMLAGMGSRASGRLAYATVTREMLETTGTREVDTDNFTTYPMSLRGVLIGILFLELNDGVKISFRSRGDIPINQLAKEFGGNGHKNAAGARLFNVPLDGTVRQVLAAAQKYLDTTETA